jgi:hypothetical protein
MSDQKIESDQPLKARYPAIEQALRHKESIQALQASCAGGQLLSSSNSSSNINVLGGSNLQQKWCKERTRIGTDCLSQSDTSIISRSNNCKQQQLSAEFVLIRSWRQQRQEAASVIVRAVRDWLGRRKAQQQVLCSHLQWLKGKRIWGTWRQQLAQQQLVHRELQAMQAAFAKVLENPWHASARGFDANKVYQEEGPYRVAAAYHDWRTRGVVLLAWAQQVLGCRLMGSQHTVRQAVVPM